MPEDCSWHNSRLLLVSNMLARFGFFVYYLLGAEALDMTSSPSCAQLKTIKEAPRNPTALHIYSFCA